jgi:hypothetical protein
MVRISTFVDTHFRIARRIQTVQFRHGEIQNGHVGLQECGLLHGFASVTGFGHNFPARLLFEKCAHAVADQSVIICH